MSKSYSSHPTVWSDDKYWVEITSHETEPISFKTLITDLSDDMKTFSFENEDFTKWYGTMEKYIFDILKDNSAKWFKQTLTPSFIQGKITSRIQESSFTAQEVSVDSFEFDDTKETTIEIILTGFQLDSDGFYPWFRVSNIESRQIVVDEPEESVAEEEVIQEQQETVKEEGQEIEINMIPSEEGAENEQLIELENAEDTKERKKQEVRALYESVMLQKIQADQKAQEYYETYSLSDNESTFTDYQREIDEDFSSDDESEQEITLG